MIEAKPHILCTISGVTLLKQNHEEDQHYEFFENLEKMENSNGYEQRNIERMANVKGVILLHA